MQEENNKLGEVMGTPTCRFVERVGGGTVIDLFGKSNPWSKDWYYKRKECLPCQGRLRLSGEMEEGLKTFRGNGREKG